ncbi:MAG: hypothetical protein CSA65_08265 [Proteobacteria bacterium]|nr:MAG: hypothetical protein CSA65_08265 [Pseudomonadota bacterium]
MLSLLIVLGSSRAAHAQPMPDEPGLSLQVSPQLSHPATTRLVRALRPDRSVTTAMGLSLGTTLGGVTTGLVLLFTSNGSGGRILGGLTTLFLGLTVGPSLGHFYAGEITRGVVMSLARGGASAASFLFFVLYGLSGAFEGDGNAGFGFASLGFAITTIVLAVIDLVDAPGAVRRRLARRRAQARGLSSLSVTPLVARSHQRGDVYGLTAAMRF